MLVVHAGRTEVEDAREQERKEGTKINPLLCQTLETWQ